MGLLRFTIEDDAFYEMAQDGVEIEVNLDERVVRVGDTSFSFQLSAMELALIENKGMTNAYRKLGNGIFEKLAATGDGSSLNTTASTSVGTKKLWDMDIADLDGQENALHDLQW